MKKHYVTFLSPGTLVFEETTKPISEWDVEQAKKMAHGIVERYNAVPFGFRFITRERKDDEMDSKTVDQSGVYYLGGVIRTGLEVLAGTDPDEKILRSNVECNDMERIITNTNSYKSVHEFKEGDVLLSWEKR